MSNKIYNYTALILLPLIATLLASCGINPATGHKEMQLVSEKREIRIGEAQYPYSQQRSGGIYLIDPELSAYVEEIGQKLAQHSSRPALPYSFVVINNSLPNAWAMPGGKIAVNRGLLSQLKSESQLAAVLGHEIAHTAHRHSAQATERVMMMSSGLVAAHLLLPPDPKKDLLLAGGALGALLLQTQYSKNAELEADHYSMVFMSRAGYDPQGAVDLQILYLDMHHKKSKNWLTGLFSSHPPCQERLDANRAFVKNLSSTANTFTNTFQDKEIYQQKIANLKKRAPAYKAFDDGILALEQKNSEDALAFAEKAILLEPAESLFYQLKGDALAYQNRHHAAIAAYTIAIEKNPEYYYNYQQRGFLYKYLGERGKARLDLTQSDILLPSESTKDALEDLQGRSTHVYIGVSSGPTWEAQRPVRTVRRRIVQPPPVIRRTIKPPVILPAPTIPVRRIVKPPVILRP